MKFYYNQNDYKSTPYPKNSDKTKTIATSGCGVCSVAMAINNLCGKELYTIPALAKFSINVGARDEYGTNVTKLLNAICKEHKEFSYTTTTNGNKFLEHLKNGGVGICNQYNSNYPLLSTSGHFCYCPSATGNNVYIDDPGMTSSKYTTDFRQANIIKTTKTGCLVSISKLNIATSGAVYYMISYNGKKSYSCVNPLVECNAKMNASSIVFADNTSLEKVGAVEKGEYIRQLTNGATYSIIQYGVNKQTYKCGIVPSNKVTPLK